MNNQLALITGASSGIGMHLAAEFARHGHPLALIAPVEEELISIARTLRSEHGVDVNCIACDLRNGDSAAKIAATLPGIPHVLVNNAGHGKKDTLGRFRWNKISRWCSSMSKQCSGSRSSIYREWLHREPEKS